MVSSFASPIQRAIASIADYFVISFTQFVGSYFGGLVSGLIVTQRQFSEEQVRGAMSTGMTLGWLFWGMVAVFINYGVLQGLYGSSAGKKLFGIKVTNYNGERLGVWKSLARTGAYLISALPFYFGFFSMLWTKRTQCFHDYICQTYVVKHPGTKIKKSTNTFDMGEAVLKDEDRAA